MKNSVYELESSLNTYTLDKNRISLLRECLIFKKETIGEVFFDYHHHDLYEILYVKSGKVLYSIEEKKYILNPGDIIFISPSKLHRLNSIESSNCERIVINFTEDFINKISTPKTNLLQIFKLIDESKNYKLKIHLNQIKNIESLLEAMLNSQFSDEFGCDIIFYITFSQLMINLNKMYMNTEIFAKPIINNKVVNKITDFIMDNIDQKLSIEQVASFVNLSTSRVQHIFKNETGISLNSYITKKKLLKATELLRNNEKSIDIYEKCGFQNYTSFLRAFKNEYGLTPKEYIQAHKNRFEIQYF